MTIEKMQLSHIPQIAALERLCFSDPWPEIAIASELNNPLSLWLVALEGDTVVGYIGSQSVVPEADVMNVAVSPDYRRQGIAEALITRLVEELAVRGICVLALEVRTSNAPAIGLYEKMGFSQAGLRKNYYRSPREDALILKKNFDCYED